MHANFSSSVNTKAKYYNDARYKRIDVFFVDAYEFLFFR